MSEALKALIELQTRVQTVGRGYEYTDSAARCQELFATIRARIAELEAERAELVEALADLLPFTDDLYDEGPEDYGWQSCELAAARTKAKELLEEGNE